MKKFRNLFHVILFLERRKLGVGQKAMKRKQKKQIKIMSKLAGGSVRTDKFTCAYRQFTCLGQHGKIFIRN